MPRDKSKARKRDRKGEETAPYAHHSDPYTFQDETERTRNTQPEEEPPEPEEEAQADNVTDNQDATEQEGNITDEEDENYNDSPSEISQRDFRALQTKVAEMEKTLFNGEFHRALSSLYNASRGQRQAGSEVKEHENIASSSSPTCTSNKKTHEKSMLSCNETLAVTPNSQSGLKFKIVRKKNNSPESSSRQNDNEEESEQPNNQNQPMAEELILSQLLEQQQPLQHLVLPPNAANQMEQKLPAQGNLSSNCRPHQHSTVCWPPMQYAERPNQFPTRTSVTYNNVNPSAAHSVSGGSKTRKTPERRREYTNYNQYNPRYNLRRSPLMMYNNRWPGQVPNIPPYAARNNIRQTTNFHPGVMYVRNPQSTMPCHSNHTNNNRASNIYAPPNMLVPFSSVPRTNQYLSNNPYQSYSRPTTINDMFDDDDYFNSCGNRNRRTTARTYENQSVVNYAIRAPMIQWYPPSSGPTYGQVREEPRTRYYPNTEPLTPSTSPTMTINPTQIPMNRTAQFSNIPIQRNVNVPQIPTNWTVQYQNNVYQRNMVSEGPMIPNIIAPHEPYVALFVPENHRNQNIVQMPMNVDVGLQNNAPQEVQDVNNVEPIVVMDVSDMNSYNNENISTEHANEPNNIPSNAEQVQQVAAEALAEVPAIHLPTPPITPVYSAVPRISQEVNSNQIEEMSGSFDRQWMQQISRVTAPPRKKVNKKK